LVFGFVIAVVTLAFIGERWLLVDAPVSTIEREIALRPVDARLAN
jgi:hypothetical protein